MHEILTLQFGHSANYVATHFWNTQQSYFTYGDDDIPTPVDHDVHFCAGIGAAGVETYTPRTLIYDLKGGFGTMKRVNALYDIDCGATDSSHDEIWNNNVTMHKEPQIVVHPYITSLEMGTEPAPLTTDSVRYWSDFNSVYYHPRSIVQLYQCEVNSAAASFESHTDGRELFASINKKNDIQDRDFRYLAEQCDQLQGVQIFTTTDEGWGGFASEYALTLNDEYPKTELWTWGIERGERVAMANRNLRTLGLANVLNTLMPLSSLYVPLVSPPLHLPKHFFEVDYSSEWHKAALLSAAVETVTLPTRLKAPAFSCGMTHASTILNSSGSRNIALLSMTVPRDHNFIGRPQPHAPANAFPSEQDVDLSWTGVREERHVFTDLKVARGAGTDSPQAIPGTVFHTDLNYPIPESYPSIFTGATGSVSFSSSLRTSSVVLDKLRRIRDVVLSYAPVDEREDLYNQLSGFASAYDEDWVSNGSDSGDDDG